MSRKLDRHQIFGFKDSRCISLTFLLLWNSILHPCNSVWNESDCFPLKRSGLVFSFSALNLFLGSINRMPLDLTSCSLQLIKILDQIVHQNVSKTDISSNYSVNCVKIVKNTLFHTEIILFMDNKVFYGLQF